MDRGRNDRGESTRTNADGGKTGDVAQQGDGHGRAHDRRSLGRRAFVGSAAIAGSGLLAGCGTLLEGSGDGSTADLTLADFRGSGPLVEERDQPGGTSIDDLPDLDGELRFYLSGGEGGLYIELIDLLDEYYPDFSYSETQESAGILANRVVQENEGGTVQADVFMANDASALGTISEAGATQELPSAVQDAVRQSQRTDQWVGFAGRARAVPYNTDRLSAGDVPDAVADFPDVDAFADAFGWAPTYPAFQSFVTAMLLLEGEETTRTWLEDIQGLGASTFASEFNVTNSTANGAINGGFANHYYALRVRSQRPDAPVDLTFTSGDAGALINVSAGAVLSGAEDSELAENFLRHLVSAEAQEFFATRAFAYPTVAEVDPVGGLPSIGELNPPNIDLADLANNDQTLDLLEETGLLS